MSLLPAPCHVGRSCCAVQQVDRMVPPLWFLFSEWVCVPIGIYIYNIYVYIYIYLYWYLCYHRFEYQWYTQGASTKTDARLLARRAIPEADEISIKSVVLAARPPWNFRVAMWDLALTVSDLVLEDILFSVYSRDGLHGPGFCWF